MSDTPRTDEREMAVDSCEYVWVVSANFARGLERELNKAEAAIRHQQLLDEENQRLKERVKRLEEAGDAMDPWCNDKVAIDAWRAAKEAA